MNACGNYLMKFKDGHRAVEILQTHPEKDTDTRWGGDGSTPVRPQVVYRV